VTLRAPWLKLEICSGLLADIQAIITGCRSVAQSCVHLCVVGTVSCINRRREMALAWKSNTDSRGSNIVTKPNNRLKQSKRHHHSFNH
jgi:hypothetical protein